MEAGPQTAKRQMPAERQNTPLQAGDTRPSQEHAKNNPPSNKMT